MKNSLLPLLQKELQANTIRTFTEVLVAYKHYMYYLKELQEITAIIEKRKNIG